MSEFWGWCATCQRSFYLGPAASSEPPTNAQCPVCLASPAEIRTAEPR